MQSMSTSNDITGAVVKDACCPSQDDPESCNTAVDTWWPAISAAMAASENMAPITCAVLDCGDAAKLGIVTPVRHAWRMCGALQLDLCKTPLLLNT
ncbi:hypothetical protein TCAL_14808 [Tigriopus californicus]|uniref:Uncharacterized protein n=1 Tax=Tigriopus californicus TaxID=6832 RepID=A0A553PR33_TIGCA|nr:hypothetical protein TCAL_14808 [Tigriopus californicus]